MLLALFACRYAPDTDPAAVPGAETITEVEVTAATWVPNVLTVTWTSSAEGSSEVEYGVDGEIDHATPPSPTPALSHSVTVLGLPVGVEAVLRPVTVLPDGTRIEGELVTLRTQLPPTPLPIASATTYDSAASGYILLNFVGEEESTVMIMDRGGNPVWYARATAGQLASSSMISLDRTAVLFNSYAVQLLTDEGTIERVALDGSTWETIAAPGHHHDFTELPDGQYAYLAAEARAWGIDEVLGDEIRVVSAGVAPVRVFTAWDELDPYAMCSHFRPTAAADGALDWLHANSILYEPADDSFRLLARNLDAIFAIDRATGAIQWQMGGTDSDFALTGEPWDHGHYSQRWDGGMMVFDNGLHREPAAAQVAEYAVDEDARTLERVWSSELDGPAESLGDVKKLPDDSYLVAWPETGLVQQVGYDGSVLWEAQLPAGYRAGHVSWIGDLYAGE